MMRERLLSPSRAQSRAAGSAKLGDGPDDIREQRTSARFEEDTKTFDENVSTRRVSVAFFHKANYDAAVDAKELLAFGGFGEAAARDVTRKRPRRYCRRAEPRGHAEEVREAGHGSWRKRPLAYHEALMGGRRRRGGGVFERGPPPTKKKARRERSPRVATSPRGAARGDGVRCRCCPPVSGDGLGFDRGSDDRGAGLGNDNPSAQCPVCKGTGWKPCGQCDGTGVNQDDLFGGKFLKGDTCWLCSGRPRPCAATASTSRFVLKIS